jgi:hypothetical protein
MIGMKLDRLKGLFFDRKAVTARMDVATRKALSKAGAFVRQHAKGSIRKRKKTSEPSKPPNSHTGLLKNNIFFAYDPSKQSVVVGPTLMNAKSSGVAPKMLEFGGEQTITTKAGDKIAVYKARPYMGPALRAELPKFPELWKNAL